MQPYRVALIDDSAVVRGMIARWLSEDGEIDVVARHTNGARALKNISEGSPEVAVLDIEMPEMDGITALPKILEKLPKLKIIMASTLTLRNAEISLKALSLGAADYVPKPETRGLAGSEVFRDELLRKVKALGAAAREASQATGYRPGQLRRTPGHARSQSQSHADSKAPDSAEPRRGFRSSISGAGTGATGTTAGAPSAGEITLRKQSVSRPEVLAIGSSTGGPQALMELLGALRGRLSVPVLITQHMPPMFTAILAEHMAKASDLPAMEASDGDVIHPKTVYVAPGDKHMLVENRGGSRRIRLSNEPPENFCRPAVDPMLRSVAEVYGARALTVILTGMGHDGREGARQIASVGGTIIAQDQETSVVWGMPGAVARAGLCSAVEPLKKLPQSIETLLQGGRL